MRTALVALAWSVFVGGLTFWVLSAAGTRSPRLVLDKRSPRFGSRLSDDGRWLAQLSPAELDAEAPSRLAIVDLTHPANDLVLHDGPQIVQHVAFVDDGKLVAAVLGDPVALTYDAVLWDRQSAREVRRTPLLVDGNAVTGFAFQQDGAPVCIISSLTQWHSIDGRTGKVLGTYDADVPPPGAIGRCGAYLMSAGERGTSVWRAATGESVGRFPAPPADWQVSGLKTYVNVVQEVNGECLLLNLGEDRIQFWNATTGERREIPTPAPFDAEISRDGRWLLVNSLEIPPAPTPAWWEKLLVEWGLADLPRNLPRIDPADELMPCTRLFDLATGMPVALPRSTGTCRMAPDGTIAIWSEGKLFVFDNPVPPRYLPLASGAVVGIVVGLAIVAISGRRKAA